MHYYLQLFELSFSCEEKEFYCCFSYVHTLAQACCFCEDPLPRVLVLALCSLCYNNHNHDKQYDTGQEVGTQVTAENEARPQSQANLLVVVSVNSCHDCSVSMRRIVSEWKSLGCLRSWSWLVSVGNGINSHPLYVASTDSQEKE